MEPTAYDMYLKTGVFPDGTMFALVIYSSETNRSINRRGFVMGTDQATEMHLKDSKKFPKAGFNFYAFPRGVTHAAAAALPNECVDCHAKHAAFDGVFTQFYPVLRDRVAEIADARETRLHWSRRSATEWEIQVTRKGSAAPGAACS